MSGSFDSCSCSSVTSFSFSSLSTLAGPLLRSVSCAVAGGGIPEAALTGAGGGPGCSSSMGTTSFASPRLGSGGVNGGPHRRGAALRGSGSDDGIPLGRLREERPAEEQPADSRGDGEGGHLE